MLGVFGRKKNAVAATRTVIDPSTKKIQGHDYDESQYVFSVAVLIQHTL